MVEVVGPFLFVGKVAGVLVVGVLGDDHNSLIAEPFGYGLHYRSLA